MTWTTSCPDWGDRIKIGTSIVPPPIFPAEAESALAIFKDLKIVDAPGSPTFGDVGAEWVFDIVRSVFGAYDSGYDSNGYETGSPTAGRRLITEWFILVPKKNSKSTLAAGIMMTALILNWRQSAEFAILAPTVEVATNSFSPSRDMVAKDDTLGDLMLVQSHTKTITNRNSNATLKVLAADSNTVGGKKTVGTLIDELHLFGKIGSSENMFREATGGLASRPEGFVIYLTTQSDEPPSGVFKQKLQYARDVRDGIIQDPRFVPIIFEHPPDMVNSGAHLLEETMYLVNPNLGYSVDREFLTREYRKAKESGGQSFSGFMAKHANVEIGLSLRNDRWAGADFWQECAGIITLDDILERSDVIEIGIDGGGLDDLLGLAVLGRDAVTRDWLLWTRAWAHPIALERRKSEAARYRDFERDGDLIIVGEIGEDVEQVGEIVIRCEESGLLDRIGVDPVGIGDIVDEITSRDIDHDRVVGIPQGWRLSGAIKTLERRAAEKTILHGGTSMMNWCVSNARVEPRGNAILVTKQASGTGKIDPLIAVFNATALMAMNPEPRGGRSVYEDRGVMVI